MKGHLIKFNQAHNFPPQASEQSAEIYTEFVANALSGFPIHHIISQSFTTKYCLYPFPPINALHDPSKAFN